ncbi:MAG: CRISPR-associated endoribonuclease Cas6, partial [Armatimonadota bacterium]|nr:CRISPR-associated endoribonuclease Cas6 [Armatimonadota bacterium]
DEGGGMKDESTTSSIHPSSFIPHPSEERRRFKLFVFAQLRAEHSRAQGDRLHLWPGAVEWQIASPVEPFLTNFASGLLAMGTLRIDRVCLPVAGAETLPLPEFTSPMRFKCLSPIVVAVHDPNRRTPRYLRPDAPEFSERVRQNLIAKYRALHGRAPEDDRQTLTFDVDYLKTHKGTKLMTYKGIQIVGAFCPFTLAGSTELMRVGYECGLGEKNAGGFGMVEVIER